MKGRARAANRDYDLAIVTAHQGEAFARTKKLKGLAEYLSHDGADKAPVQPEVILDAMLTMQAQGIGMTIRKVR